VFLIGLDFSCQGGSTTVVLGDNNLLWALPDRISSRAPTGEPTVPPVRLHVLDTPRYGSSNSDTRAKSVSIEENPVVSRGSTYGVTGFFYDGRVRRCGFPGPAIGSAASWRSLT